jgi:hypothetical protein
MMGVEETVQQRIQQLGWKQGQVFDGALKDALVSNATEKFPWADEAGSLILFSQDCDLLHHSLENEPFVEFLCAQSIETCDVSFKHGKNPRRLHVEDTKGAWFHVQMSHRIRIPKNQIDESFPVSDKELTKESLSTLVSWLSKRYSRPAFPDLFNTYLSRIKNLDNKLMKLNESYPLVKRFFFCLDPFSDIPPTDAYNLEIRVLLHGSSSEAGHETDMKENIEKKVEKLFSGPHIRIEDVCCSFEDEMTLLELSYFRVWDKEYLSSRYGFIQ